MGLCKRQALRRLLRLDGQFGGRLLRSMGDKHMPGRVQPSKYHVSTAVLREALRVERSDVERDILTIRLEQALITQKVETLRRVVRPLMRRGGSRNAT